MTVSLDEYLTRKEDFRAWVLKTKERQVQVGVYIGFALTELLDRPNVWRDLVEMGVDTCITNLPTRLQEWNLA